MDIGIYYLYEHKKQQKLRNTGFMKITKQEHTCFLQLNARSLPVTQQDTAELSVFYMDNDSANAIHLSSISCGNQTISGKIAAAESFFPNQYTLNQIDGFFLTLPHGEILAATAPNVKFDTQKITFLSDKVMTETAEPESVSNSPKNEPEPKTETLPEAPESQAEALHETPNALAEAPSETSEPQTEALHAPPKSLEETPSETPESQTEALHETRESLAEAHTKTPGSELQKSSEPQSSARKIQRSELSALPRRHWNLANNSFLLHGYYNYNHLLLVEEAGHYWLGVPGIYDPRESRAAELFGFSQFTDSYNQQLALTEDECSNYGRFGYWCRYLK